ncbi:hypothetical protein L3X38_033954 [Prunus dulcis]|uniref:Uncharacterized protein n=1 Tax=Prunus dulcis TaxID=3755 RepID=A0AAD4VHZ6_PRUDU|nr:hypothetical protein L3X38_033954 [Prunus dulcis]
MAVEGGGDRHWATGEELMEVVQGWEVGRLGFERMGGRGAVELGEKMNLCSCSSFRSRPFRWGISSSTLCASKGASKQLSKGAAMDSLANFPAFQGVVRPLLSQGGSAPASE